MKLLSFGEIVWDVQDENVSLGGAPLNLAVHTAMQGEDALLVSAVGNDKLGRKAVRAAESYGVDTEFVSVLDDMETAVCTVTVGDMGTPSYELMGHSSFDCIAVPVIDEYVDIIAFGTLSLRHENNRGVIRRMLERIPHSEVFCDINLRAPFYSVETIKYCLSNATLLKVSSEELPEVSRLVLGEYRDIESAVCGLHGEYPSIKLFIITLGSDGSLCFDSRGGQYYRSDAKKTDVLSTVGAGDSFSAAFLACYMKGKCIGDCLEYASEISSMVCADKAAFSKEMEARINQIKGGKA